MTDAMRAWHENPWLTPLAVVAVVLALGLASRRVSSDSLASLRLALDSQWAPYCVGLSTMLFIGWMWGTLDAPSLIHDEAAYLLQADIFASGHLSGDPPPLPEFFEQFHVLLTPRLAPKYWPGHALALVPGMWLGLPGLMPVVFHGLAAGLLFALARRLAGSLVALMTWLVWLSAPALNLWRCSYLSASTSTALWLLATWCLWRWWEGGRARDLVALGFFAAWLAMTRPLTALAFGLPSGVLVLIGVRRRGSWRALGAAIAAGLAVLAIIPVWSQASIGDWRRTPYTEYGRLYLPWDHLGFGDVASPPLRPVTPEMEAFANGYRPWHAAYTPSAVPSALVQRVVAVGQEMWGGPRWRAPLLLFFVLALPFLPGPARFALAWTASLFACHLVYVHPPVWAIYYHETHPILAFVTAYGLWRVLAWLATGHWRPSVEPVARLALPVVAVSLLGLTVGLSSLFQAKRLEHERLGYHRAFAWIIAGIPDRRAVVFVRYKPNHNPHLSLIENPADHSRARIWVVHDRGADNVRLLAVAPERVPYLFDEASFALYRLTAAP
jgi:hypothetical protein